MLYAQKEYKKAITSFQKALDISIKIFGEHHPEIAKSYNWIGLSYQSLSDDGKANKNYNLAWKSVKNSQDVNLRIEVFKNLSKLNEKMNDIDLAIDYLEDAIDLVLKHRLEMQRGRTSFVQKYKGLFKELFRLYLKEEQKQEAFETSEKFRGLSIVENMNLEKALSKVTEKEIVNDLLRYKKELKSLESQRMAAYEKKDSELATKLWKQMIELEEKIESIDKKLIEEYPAYAKERELRIPRESRIRRLLKKVYKENSIIVSYVLLPNVNGSFELSVFLISKDNFHYIPLGEKPLLKHKVETLRSILSVRPENRDSFVMLKSPEGIDKLCNKEECYEAEEGKDVYVLSSSKKVFLGRKIKDANKEEVNSLRKKLQKELYKDLIAPIDKTEEWNRPNTSIIFVPDSFLYTIPFFVLIDEKNKYLIENYNVSMIHSASVWYTYIAKHQAEYQNPLLVFGNPVYTNDHRDIYPEDREELLGTENSGKNSH